MEHDYQEVVRVLEREVQGVRLGGGGPGQAAGSGVVSTRRWSECWRGSSRIQGTRPGYREWKGKY